MLRGRARIHITIERVPHRAGDALTVTRYSALDEIPAATWDEIAASATFYSTAEWLRQFEGAGRPYASIEATYLVVRRGGEAVALAQCYTVRRNAGRVPPRIDLHAACFGDGAPLTPAELDPYLICGSPVGENRLLLRAGLPPAERRETLKRVIVAVRELAESTRAKAVAFGILPTEAAAELLALDDSFLPAFGVFDCSLALPGDFDAFLASLGGHRRKRVKADVRHFEQEGLRFETRRLGEISDDAAPLMVLSERKWDVELDVEWLRDAFRKMARLMDHRTKVFCVRKGSTLVAWAMVFVHRDTYYLRLNGKDDAAVSKRAALYFNNVFYEPMRAAPADGVKTIHYGSGSLVAKIAHGCRVTPLAYLVSVAPDSTARARDAIRAYSRAAIAEERQLLEKSGMSPERVGEELRLEPLRRLLGPEVVSA